MLPLPPPPALPAPARAEEVAAAERAFAADAARRGTPAAFVSAFAEDGLVFTPRAENARARYGAKPEDGSRLAWAPAFVEVAASGDFAISTGPWSWRAKGATAPSAAGHFLSLWVRRGGRWQVQLDLGVSHPAQAEAPLVLRTHGPGAPGPGPEAAWRTFDAAAAGDLRAALEGAGAADLRLYREGRPVSPGNLAAGAAAEGGPAAWEPQGRMVAASRDLAVRWGVRTRGPARATGLQVWRRDGGAWRLAMDVALPWP
ncbi:hypothetical protein GETHPA_12930 [Geothrix rubra]|uniref:DUF4440 domain-containing protein n=1 Tax=Geothrix rubra TaxID=2927977 RepID=A0ABQ5Q4T9_9BACT|nr:nuclear transport factor 2 family protein [Geothrix rubra]GLH69760.1 hypothetical protein GETHPA_12930 [Geothrix rubra]